MADGLEKFGIRIKGEVMFSLRFRRVKDMGQWCGKIKNKV